MRCAQWTPWDTRDQHAVPCMTCVAEAVSCRQTEAAYLDGVSVAFARLRNLHAHQLHHHAGDCQAYYTYLARGAPEKDALVRRSTLLADGFLRCALRATCTYMRRMIALSAAVTELYMVRCRCLSSRRAGGWMQTCAACTRHKQSSLCGAARPATPCGTSATAVWRLTKLVQPRSGASYDCLCSEADVSSPRLLLHRQAYSCIPSHMSPAADIINARRLQGEHFHERTHCGSFCCARAHCPA